MTSSGTMSIDATMSRVADNRIKTGMTFADIVRGNQSPKSFKRFNPVIPAQKKDLPQKKQVVRFTLLWWKMFLDSCATYHTVLLTWFLNNAENSDTTLVRKFNARVSSYSLKGYYGKFHMWINKNRMANFLSIYWLG